MAREIIPVIAVSDYISDRGTTYPALSGRIGKPADLSDAQFDNLLQDMALRRKTAADSSPCPVGAGFKPRKLSFVRQDGNQLSFLFVDRTQAINTATLIRDAINAATPTNQVVCIQLLGEVWDDLTLELRPAGLAVTSGTPSRVTTGGKQRQHSGKIPYQYDGRNGDTTTVSVKVDTDVVSAQGVTSPPTILGPQWQNCVGLFDPANPCPSRSTIKHRRYMATFQVADGADTFYQRTEVPVRVVTAADILQCGTNLASIASTVCLGYKGETNQRLHDLL